MKQLLGYAALFLMSFSYALGQSNGTARVPYAVQPHSPMWGNDVLIHSREPMGRPSAVGRSNGTAYVAIPDTAFNRSLTSYRTTDFGRTWTGFTTFGPPQQVVDKVKMVRGANDSIYIYYLSEGILTYGNFETPTSLRQYTVTGLRDFDVAMSSTGGTYLFYDLNASNSISRAASADYGATWPQVAVVTSAGANPRVFMNSNALDTLILNYYGPVRANDTLRSVIRQARYREVATGNLASAAFINVDIDTTTLDRGQYGSAKLGNVVWFFNTRGAAGSQDIQLRVSTDAGLTYGAPANIAGLANVDESWFDFKNYTLLSGGLDFVYYADSAGTANDRLMYAYFSKSSPSTLSGLVRLSDRPVVTSARGYIPTVFEYYDAEGEVGVVWVGLDGTERKVYYDRFDAVSGPTSVVQTGGVPDSYTLKQNYPNPFNPSTTIEFAIPESEFVTVKIFDLLGGEVQTLFAENLNAGSYKTRFNAENLASGVYLYQLRAGSHVQTMKLTVMK